MSTVAMAASTQLLLPLLGLVPDPPVTRGRSCTGGIETLPKLRSRCGLQVDFVAKATNNSPNATEPPRRPQAENPEGDLKKRPPGFVGTWFDDAFQYTAWPEIHRLLTERKVKDVEWPKAYDLSQSGAAILIDVREAQDFGRVHAEGSFGAPLFRLIQGNDFKSNMRRLGYALITEFAGTERNPDFVKQALQAVDGDKEKLVVVICDIGGTLDTFVERKGPKAKKFADPERRFGRASRSLRAVFELQEAGFTNVTYLSGGLNTWLHQNMPTEGAVQGITLQEKT